VVGFPTLQLAFRLLAGNTIALLDLTQQLIAFSGDFVEIVVGELAAVP